VSTVGKVIVVKRGDGEVAMKEGRDVWWHDEISAADIKNYCEPEHMDAEDPLFILYTSGSTGSLRECFIPRRILHIYESHLQVIFDYS